MRLIDAEKLKPFTVTFPAGLMRRHPSAAHFYAEGAQQVLDIIAAAPTVAPETLRPVSYWKGTESGYNCALCEADAPSDACGFTVFSRYCPNCGARMEGQQCL